jgi:hypothetical protein
VKNKYWADCAMLGNVGLLLVNYPLPCGYLLDSDGALIAILIFLFLLPSFVDDFK